MKKVSFIIAGLVSLLLVGCGGSEGSVTSADNNLNTGTTVSTGTSSAVSTGVSLAPGLTPPPAFPEQ